MKLGIDCDGVLRNFTGKLIEVYKREYPDHKCPKNDDDFYTFSLSPLFELGNGIYDFAFRKHAKEIYTEAKAYKNASTFMKELKKLGHNIFIITSQPNDICKESTLKWIEKNNIFNEGIIFSDNKGEVPVDILLDDYDKNLNSFKNAGKIPICFHRPWNLSWEGIRIKNYDEFIKTINIIENNTYGS